MASGNVPAEVRVPRSTQRVFSRVALVTILVAAILACGGLFSRAKRPPPFEVHAHRGALGALPPGNLKSAFMEGIRLGATSVEADIRFTRDGKAVVNHDPQLPPACSFPPGIERERTISELTWQEVRSVACVTPSGNAEPPLRLEQLLDLHELGPFGFNIEIKLGPRGAAEKVASIVQTYNRACDDCLDDRILFQSFQIEDLVTLGRIFPKKHGRRPHGVRLSFLSNAPSVTEPGIVAPFVDVYSPDHRSVTSFEPLVRAAHEQEIRFIPWTVNNATRICEAAKAGADGVITDFPQRASEIAALIATANRRPRTCP